jgi:hypothetical protein
MRCFLVIFTPCSCFAAKVVLVLWASLLTGQDARAENTSLKNLSQSSVIRFSTQLGVDAWDLNTPSRTTTRLKGVDRLYLPDSHTKWQYKNTSPWIKVTSQWDLTSNFSISSKARAEQSVGYLVDELNMDYRLSPMVGFRAGVLDYKTSWCRTYETDSPWIQEINPFCTNRVTNEASLASPGLQAYLNFSPSHYLIQSLIGIYRPKAFGYNENEFSNVANTKGVAINDRWGWSINVLDRDTATEFRLSWLAAYQENNRDDYGYRGQKAGALYLATSFFPAEKLNVRAQFFDSLVNQASYAEPPAYDQILETNMARQSKSIEFIYQISALDTLGVATSRYTFNWHLTGMNGYESYTNPNYYQFSQSSNSVTWRHSWPKGIYTSLQWMKSKNDQLLILTTSKADGEALGFRLGFNY